MKYPKVGENFYWEDSDGNIIEDTCLKIEGEDVDTLETMFFISLYKTGSGCFVTESDIIDSNSNKVKEYKKSLVEKKIKEISTLVSQKEVYDVLLNKFNENGFKEIATNILDILKNYE